MKAIQSVAYALTGVNIFAKASASSYASMAGSAKKAKQETKQLAGIHDEINNIQNNDNSDNGGGSVSPSFDLSGLDGQMSPFAQKLYDFFRPLVDSWNTYGQGLIEQFKTTIRQIGGLLSSVWGSFENIIANGTVYSILQNILAIIGNIANAFSNACNYNGNGDAIVQNLANAFNNLLGAINTVVQSDGFQNWLNNCSDKFREITEKIASIDWQPLVDALVKIGTTVGTIALEILSGLVDIFKWLVENPIVAEILLGIAIAIGLVATAISIYNTAMEIYNVLIPIATAVSTAFGISIGGLIGIILAIIAVIALIVVAIINWDSIIKALADTWNWICEQAQIIWNTIAEFFTNLWQKICDTATNIWNDICNFFKSIWDWIANLASSIWNGIINTISNVINTIKETIQNVLNTIKTIWDNIWNGLKNTVTNIFNGIWNVIRNVINWILNGIEKMGNGVVNGINTVIRALNTLHFDMPDWLGGGTFGFNIPTLGQISLPRLAKGGVLTEATAVIAGEYSGAKSNPEIVTPQNILRETFDEVLSKYDGNQNNNIPIYLTVNVGDKKLGQILLEDLRNMKRSTGKGIEALVGG